MMFSNSIYAVNNTVNIEYNGNLNKFSIDENEDLFVNLKNVVPGDNVTQKIKLNIVDLKNGDEVKIYLKAENANKDYNTLETLSGVNLTVNNNGRSIEEKISSPLLLGSFSKNESVNLDVNLIVDKTVGNEIANLNANIDWIFTAETIENSDMPKTGDGFNPIWVILMLIISLGFIISILIKRKRK